MRLSEIEKDDNFVELAELAHLYVDAYENYDHLKEEFRERMRDMGIPYDKSITAANQLDNWYRKNVWDKDGR